MGNFCVTSPTFPTPTASQYEPPPEVASSHTLIIIAASLGSAFEWYDFFLDGSLAPIIAQHYYSSLPDGRAFAMALFTFAAGYVFRPFGAIVFGKLGDMFGRKYTFLATIIIMGSTTFLSGKIFSL
jgi:MFS family permease